MHLSERKKNLARMEKKCLKKLIGSERLSFTELSTVLFEIENVLKYSTVVFYVQ